MQEGARRQATLDAWADGHDGQRLSVCQVALAAAASQELYGRNLRLVSHIASRLRSKGLAKGLAIEVRCEQRGQGRMSLL